MGRAPPPPESKVQAKFQTRPNPNLAASKAEVLKAPPQPTKRPTPVSPPAKPKKITASTSPKLRSAKLPWIAATKTQVKAAKSKKATHLHFEQNQLEIPTKEEKEHKTSKLPLCTSLAPKKVAPPEWQCPPTRYYLPPLKPYPVVHTPSSKTEEKNSSRAETLLRETNPSLYNSAEKASASVQELNELLKKLICDLNLTMPS